METKRLAFLPDLNLGLGGATESNNKNKTQQSQNNKQN